MTFVAKFPRRLYYDSDFPIFSIPIKILMNEADKNSDRAAS